MQKTILSHQPGRAIDSMPEFIHKSYIGKEDEFQKAVAIYLKFNGALWFHCPNGGSRNAIEASKFKAMGVMPGVPDCMVLDARHGFSGLAIELKVGKNKPSEHQLSMANRLVAAGWLVCITWSLDDAIALIDWWFQ
jgi:hypothetical protein